MSETSEGTGTTSISGKSNFETEMQNFATLLGIANPEDVHQDRFRVDRRKLEHMLLGEYPSLLIIYILIHIINKCWKCITFLIELDLQIFYSFYFSNVRIFFSWLDELLFRILWIRLHKIESRSPFFSIHSRSDLICIYWYISTHVMILV